MLWWSIFNVPLVWRMSQHGVLMNIYQLPTKDFCDVKYSKVPKGGGAIFRGNTVFVGDIANTDAVCE